MIRLKNVISCVYCIEIVCLNGVDKVYEMNSVLLDSIAFSTKK